MERVVFITGASSGIGEALAREHHRRGDRVVVLARRVERLHALATELGGPARCLPLAGDVTSRADLDAAVAQAEREFGRVDVVYANAGFGVDGRFEDLSVDDVRRQFETNVFGVLHTAWASLEALTRTRGVFAVVGSVAGFFAGPGSFAYSMSKFAVRAFAEGMAAKDDGALHLEDFGGEGRAVLTSSASIETSSAPEAGEGLSVYTRFLVEGIRTGAADRQQRGFVDAEDLHLYVSRRVAEAAPAMTPQFFPTRSGHRIRKYDVIGLS